MDIWPRDGLSSGRDANQPSAGPDPKPPGRRRPRHARTGGQIACLCRWVAMDPAGPGPWPSRGPAATCPEPARAPIAGAHSVWRSSHALTRKKRPGPMSVRPRTGRAGELRAGGDPGQGWADVRGSVGSGTRPRGASSRFRVLPGPGSRAECFKLGLTSTAAQRGSNSRHTWWQGRV